MLKCIFFFFCMSQGQETEKQNKQKHCSKQLCGNTLTMNQCEGWLQSICHPTFSCPLAFAGAAPPARIAFLPTAFLGNGILPEAWVQHSPPGCLPSFAFPPSHPCLQIPWLEEMSPPPKHSIQGTAQSGGSAGGTVAQLSFRQFSSRKLPRVPGGQGSRFSSSFPRETAESGQQESAAQQTFFK